MKPMEIFLHMQSLETREEMIEYLRSLPRCDEYTDDEDEDI